MQPAEAGAGGAGGGGRAGPCSRGGKPKAEREGNQVEVGGGRYGVKLPLLDFERVRLAYGQTEEGLVALGHQARRWKADKAAGRVQLVDCVEVQEGGRAQLPRRRAGAKVRAMRR